MLEYINSLKEKPESYKKKIRLVFSAGVTGAIFFVWITARFAGIGGGEIAKANVTPVESISNNVSDMTASAGTAWDGVKEKFSSAWQDVESKYSDLKAMFSAGKN